MQTHFSISIFQLIHTIIHISPLLSLQVTSIAQTTDLHKEHTESDIKENLSMLFGGTVGTVTLCFSVVRGAEESWGGNIQSVKANNKLKNGAATHIPNPKLHKIV